VRELRNVLERAAIVCEGTVIDTEHLSLAGPEEVPSAGSTNLGTLERRAIEQALRDLAGNKKRAAQRLRISRTQLYSRFQQYGVRGDGPVALGDATELSKRA
jgi:two-component system NtrC family response regulator